MPVAWDELRELGRSSVPVFSVVPGGDNGQAETVSANSRIACSLHYSRSLAKEIREMQVEILSDSGVSSLAGFDYSILLQWSDVSEE